MSKGIAIALTIACVLAAAASANRLAAQAVPTRGQLPAIALPDSVLARVSAELREKYAFFSTAADAAASTADPNDTGADLNRLGRVAGYVRGRNVRGAFTYHAAKGLLTVSTSVILWRDSAAARASISLELANQKRFVGKKLPGGLFVSAACSKVGSLAATICHERARPTKGTDDFFGTVVMFNVDQLRGNVIISRSDNANVDTLALSLAAQLRQRMLAAFGRHH